MAGVDDATAERIAGEGAYPQIQPLLSTLPARVERARGIVEVPAGPGLPPRIARHVAGRGCIQLPIGATADSVPLPAPLPQPDLAAADARPWPLGEANATATLPAARRKAVDAVVNDAIATHRYGANSRTSAVLVVKDGRIVAERYALGMGPHTPQRTFSVAKSLASALIGRATMLGLIDPAKPANIPEWRTPGDPRAAITVDQLLRMASGLWTNGPGNRTDALYLGGSAVAETAGAAPIEVPAGTRFNYANNDSLLAARALWTNLGPAADRFAADQLLLPLGMTRTTIESDWQGSPILSSQVWMTARDMARLAMLHMNDGVAGGTRLLPEGWVQVATSPLGPQPQEREGLGYGRALWLMTAPGLPAGTYGFIGNQGQYAIIMPAKNLVIVRRAFDPPGAGFDFAAFARDMVAAIG